MNTNDYKWLIPSSIGSQSIQSEKATWDEAYRNPHERFSLIIDPEFCKKLILAKSEPHGCNIPNSPDIKVLIPGCGFEIYLQKTLLEFCPNIGQIYSTDFSTTAVEEALKRWQEIDGDAKLNSQQIIFEEADSTRLTEQNPDWQEKFDYVIVVGSVISSDDERNRQMLREFYKVLKPGGKLYGSFPSIFLDLEVAYLSKSQAHLLTDGSINLPESACYYGGNQREIYYTPLRLNRIFKEAGFKRLKFELFFGDSDILINQVKEKAGIDDPDLCYWEFLVRLEKQALG
jgi:SAM-dependent methyltransferase